MSHELTPWVAIMVIAIVTFLSRIAGPLLMSRIETSRRLERFLHAMSISVIAALVATILFQNGWREAASVALSMAVMMWSKNAVLAMLSGMGIASVWALILSQ